jgi:hypothetical protein
VTRTLRNAAISLPLTTCCLLSPSPNFAQETSLLPEVTVSAPRAAAPPHPQDPTYSERLPGCVEVITPNSGGNAGFSFAAASRAKHGIPVIPNLNDPRAAADYWRKGPTYEQSPATPPGQEGKPGCQR